MKKRILSLFLAFSLAGGICVAGAGNSAEAAVSPYISAGDDQGQLSTTPDASGNWVYTLTDRDMVDTIGSFYARPNLMTTGMTGYALPSDGAVSLVLARNATSGLGDIVSADATGVVKANTRGKSMQLAATGTTTTDSITTAEDSWQWAFDNGGLAPAGARTNVLNGKHAYEGEPMTNMALQIGGTSSISPAGLKADFTVNVPAGVFVSGGAISGSAVSSYASPFTSNRAGTYAFKSFGGATKLSLPLLQQTTNNRYFAGYTLSGSGFNGSTAAGYNNVTLVGEQITGNRNATYVANYVATGDSIILLDYSKFDKGLQRKVELVDGSEFNEDNSGQGYAAADNTGKTGIQMLPTAVIDGVYYGLWNEIDPRTGVVIDPEVNAYRQTDERPTNLRVFQLVDDGNTDPIYDYVDPSNKSTITGTGRYGNTLTCTDAYSREGTTYTWYRGIFKKTAGDTAEPLRQVRLLRFDASAGNNGANQYVIRDIYNTTKVGTTTQEYVKDLGYEPIEWDFRVQSGVDANLNDDTEEYRVWCVIQQPGHDPYSTRTVKIDRTILDRTDFVYGTNQESYVTWKAGINDNESDIIDPVFRDKNGNNIPIALRNELNSDGYYFEIRYRDVDQAKEVDAGRVKGINDKNNFRAASEYYVDGTLETELNGIYNYNNWGTDRGTATGYGYNFLTGEELRTSGQVGRYEVYVVGIYQKEDHKTPEISAGTAKQISNNYSVGVNGEIINNDTEGLEKMALDSNGGNNNMARRNQNNKGTVGSAATTSTPDTRVTYDDNRWGYALKDDDSAETLGNKLGKNSPAIFIGTLNIQKAKWPAGAGLHAAADNNTLPEYDNQTGYLVDNTFDVTEVNVPEKWAALDTFQWYRVDKNNNWTEIPGATKRTYKAKAADVGYYLGVRASNNNYEGTIEGTTHQEIAKRELTVNFTKGSDYREGHFTNGGQFTVDMRSLLARYGDALGDVTMELKQNVSGEGTIEKAVYSASDKNLVMTFKSFDSVPSTFAPYTISGQIEFPGHIINLKGDVRGTANDVNKVVIEPIESKEYDGVAVGTTAKVYVNEVEVTEGSQVAIRYEGVNVNYNDVKGPSNRGTYKAIATWKNATAECEFEISRRKLTAGESIAKQYGVGANLPQNLSGYFNIVQKDNVQVHNFVTKFNIDGAGVPGYGIKWNTARDIYDNHSPREGVTYVDNTVLNKVFYTPTFDIGGNFWLQFELSGTEDAKDNYDKPDAIAIQVGTGYVNASSSNISTSEEYAEQVARVNRLWKEGYVHRMVIKGGGDYLYTSSKKEALYNVRTGEWTFDDVLFKGVAQGTGGAKELVRLDKSGQRVTTIKDSKEYNYLMQHGYVDNGLIAYVYDTKVDGAVAYNRLYYPKTGTHMLQNPDNNEFKVLVEGGAWQNEGTQFYAIQP